MKVLRVKDVVKLTGLSRVTIWRFEKVGRFPSRVQLGPNSVGWIEDHVLAWIADRPLGFIPFSRAAELAQHRKGRIRNSAR